VCNVSVSIAIPTFASLLESLAIEGSNAMRLNAAAEPLVRASATFMSHDYPTQQDINLAYNVCVAELHFFACNSRRMQYAA
jgi:hypothetical protein